MAHGVRNPHWTWIAPLAAWLALIGAGLGGYYSIVLVAALIAAIIAAVHHAEVIALHTGEPFGALVLAVCVTVIEVALVLSLMMAGGAEAEGLMRDTVFATVMLILNGIVGLSLLLGGIRHHEQQFETRAASSTLAVLAALTTLTMVLPNFTTTVPGPYYSRGQLIIVASVSFILYLVFIQFQTIRHRSYFDPAGSSERAGDERESPSGLMAAASALLLIGSLGAIVLLAHAIAPTLERVVIAAGAPQAAVGVLVAAIVLLPEAAAALRAALANRLQSSLNLALGSALASTALTIPVVSLVSLIAGWPLALGLDGKATVLLVLSLLVSAISLSTGRTTVLQGAVHLVILVVYLTVTLIV
ncbi:MAG: ionic transporter y4hA [Gammaproteobacteria bacterium]|nr:ionic transporter y4hA [Gammaproteobacteria bacterium]